MKNYLITTIFILLLSLSAYAQSGNDTQLWNETTVDFNFSPDNKKVTGVVIGNLRATDDISDLSDKRIGFGVKYKASKLVTVTPSYIFRVQTASGRANRYEHRARLDITPKKSFKNFSIENRNRFEHRFKTNGRDDETYYRNRSRLKIPVRRSDKSEIVTPFVANDTYFDLQTPNLYRNDSIVGVGKDINKNLTTDFFYQYRRNFQSGTKNIHIIGINLKFKVK